MADTYTSPVYEQQLAARARLAATQADYLAVIKAMVADPTSLLAISMVLQGRQDDSLEAAEAYEAAAKAAAVELTAAWDAAKAAHA